MLGDPSCFFRCKRCCSVVVLCTTRGVVVESVLIRRSVLFFLRTTPGWLLHICSPPNVGVSLPKKYPKSTKPDVIKSGHLCVHTDTLVSLQMLHYPKVGTYTRAELPQSQPGPDCC